MSFSKQEAMLIIQGGSRVLKFTNEMFNAAGRFFLYKRLVAESLKGW